MVMDIDEILLNPANRLFIQAVLKYQIQTLLKKLSETGVETLVLTASTEDEDHGYLGSEKGTDFLNHVSLEGVRKQFLQFCANTVSEKNCSTSLAVDAPLPRKNFALESNNRWTQRHKMVRHSSICLDGISSQPSADNCQDNETEQNRSSNIESQRRISPSILIDMTNQKATGECSKSKKNLAMKSESQDRVSNPVGTEEDIDSRSNLYVCHRQKDSSVLTSGHINDSDLEMLCETVCRNSSQEIEHDKSGYKPDEIYDSSVNKERDLCHSDLHFTTSQGIDFVCMKKNDNSYLVSAKGNDSKIANEIQILGQETRIKSEPNDLDPEPSDKMYSNAEPASQSLNCELMMSENNECIVSVNSTSTVSEGRSSSTSSTGVNSINALNNSGNNCYSLESINNSSALVADIICASQFPLNSRDLTTKLPLLSNYRKMRNDLTCSECGQTFNKTPSLIRHKVRKHSPQIFQCLVCAKKYGYKSDLDKHFRTHSGEKPYMCTVCGRGFADSGNKNKHECKCRLHIRRLSVSERDNFS